MLQRHAPLAGWRDYVKPEKPNPSVSPWRPDALKHEHWPPNYRAVYAWRIKTLAQLQADPSKIVDAKKYYSTRPGAFIMDWMDTYDPRKKDNKWMPFVFFYRQKEFITFLHELRSEGENGQVEKCRDAGATWLACAYSIWSWLFVDNDAIGWGSRKQDLVDKIGDVSSIFEKMRKLLDRLPSVFKPQRYGANFMKFLNHDNGSVITGEAGDNIGRGGRTAMYFKDESAHYERPELIEAALGDNTNVQVDISSVNGLGNVFHRRRESAIEWSPGCDIPSGETRLFIIDWKHHPDKTQEWYDKRKAKSDREGMQHVFAQEVDRDYAASVTGTIIKYEWLQACIDAHKNIPYLAAIQPPETWSAGLDVADEGADRNALALRQWIIVRELIQWGQYDDVGVACRNTINAVRPHKGIVVQYDSIGVGAGVKAEYNRLLADPNEPGVTPETVRMVPWNAGAAVVDPFAHIIEGDTETLINKDFFANFKAQAWWSMRTRVYKTWRAIKFGEVYHPSELVSFDSDMPNLMTLLKELAQAVRGKSGGLRVIVDKTPDGMKSPDLADATVMAFFPAPEEHHVLVGEMLS